MLSLVLGFTSRDRESVPQVLYIGHDKALALEILETGAPDVIRTEYFNALPQPVKNRTFAAGESAAVEAPLAPEPVKEFPVLELVDEPAEEPTADAVIEEPWNDPELQQDPATDAKPPVKKGK